MLTEVSSASDSSLLRGWCEQGSQSAFAEIVRRYERLVTGAALRRAGDIELARDVAQQVFTMLAAKAPLLESRSCLAGWLHRAASLVASQLRRSDSRRVARHQLATSEPLQKPADEHWEVLEEALSELGEADREALLLHYFQDASYPAMAEELGITETTARKRVSRGLQKLGTILRKHGLNSPKALLAGAAAVQATCPANAALTASAIIGTSIISTPLPLIISALMSHLPVKIAAGVATLALIPLGYEWTANANLHTELNEARQHQQDPSLVVLRESSDPSTPPDLAQLRNELDRVESATKAAESRAAELRLFKDRVKEELVVSMGSIESMAKELGSTLRLMTESKESGAGAKDYPPGSPERQKREADMQRIQAGLPRLFGVLRELPKLERNPAKAARFYATLIGESANLNEATRAQLEPVLNAWVTRLQRDVLAFPQRPREPAEATDNWDKRRIAAMQEITRELQALVPADKSAQASLFRSLMLKPDPQGIRESFDIITGSKE